MINVLTMVFAQYLRTPFENFTDKYILARGIFPLLDKYSEEDFNEIKAIEKHTTPHIKVSLYKLDRDINPTKGEFKLTSRKFSYIQDVPDKTTIIITDGNIQHHLCIAIRRVHEIVMKVMKGYKMEQTLGDDDEDDEKTLQELFEVKDVGTPQT